MRFSGGGGVVAESFRDLKNNTRFGRGGRGGSSAEFFFSVTSKRHFPLMGPFYIFFTFPKGGPGPPPPQSATVVDLACQRSTVPYLSQLLL